jgi:hypothetical protein
MYVQFTTKLITFQLNDQTRKGNINLIN